MATLPISNQVSISSITAYIEQQSDVAKNHYVFSYQITITNNSDQTVQLLSRHWLIEDANLKKEEIYGEGVIGEQPIIAPGQSYSYKSGAILETEMGTMNGRYFFITKADESTPSNADEFEVAIPEFILSIPRTLH